MVTMTYPPPPDGDLIINHDMLWEKEILNRGCGFENKHDNLVAKTISFYLDIDSRNPVIRIIDPNWKKTGIYEIVLIIIDILVEKYAIEHNNNPVIVKLISKNMPAMPSGGAHPLERPNDKRINIGIETKKIADNNLGDPRCGFRLHDRWILGESSGVHFGPSFEDILNRDITITPIRNTLFLKVSSRFTQLWGGKT